ncbi:MAG: hypothetical protein MUC87_17810 [Bacteroidia bacterium]|nr:hypothetical protein [Bacteroidia bacterium]
MKKTIFSALGCLLLAYGSAQNCGYPATTQFLTHLTLPSTLANNTFPTSGFVGINTGTATPAAPLHIVGRIYTRPSAELIRLQMYNASGVVSNTAWRIGINYTVAPNNSASFSALCFQAPGCTGMTAQFHSNGDFLVSNRIIAPEVFVTTNIPWADYVFKPDYKLRPLSEVNSFIGLHGHLPGMPSAEEVGQQGGFEVGRLNVLLLEKVEELTLYSIQQEKRIEILQSKLDAQQSQIELLQQRIESLEKK